MYTKIAEANSQITSDWVLKNLSGTIIYKDFDLSDLSFVPPRLLQKKTIPYFDVRELKNEIYLPNKEAKTKAEKILSILLNSNVRRGSISVIDQYVPNFKEKIDRLVQKE